MCVYCGKEGPVTRDHVVPKSKGGKGATNLVPACAQCNNQKSDLDLHAWALKLERADDPRAPRVWAFVEQWFAACQ